MTTPQWQPYNGTGEIPAGVLPERLVCYRRHGDALGTTWTDTAGAVLWRKVREWRVFAPLRPLEVCATPQPLPLRLRNAARDVYAQGAPPTELEHRVVRLLREAATALEQGR